MRLSRPDQSSPATFARIFDELRHEHDLPVFSNYYLQGNLHLSPHVIKIDWIDPGIPDIPDFRGVYADTVSQFSDRFGMLFLKGVPGGLLTVEFQCRQKQAVRTLSAVALFGVINSRY